MELVPVPCEFRNGLWWYLGLAIPFLLAGVCYSVMQSAMPLTEFFQACICKRSGLWNKNSRNESLAFV